MLRLLSASRIVVRARARGYRNANTFLTMFYLLGAPMCRLIDPFTRQLTPTKSI